MASQWGLVLGDPFDPGGSLAWVAPATAPDGTPVAVKVVWPHDEARAEADALRLWDGDGAVRLLAHDPERWALLLERCDPGVPLGVDWDDSTVELGASLLRRLWRPADDAFPELAELCVRWAAGARERAARAPGLLDAGIVEEGCRLLETLSTGAPRMVLHTDLHPENVLAASREPWLAIDPKPVIGDPAWDAYQLVVQGVTDEGHLRRRLDQLDDLLGIDASRLRAWAFARSVDWAMWAGRNDPTTPWARSCADRARLLAG